MNVALDAADMLKQRLALYDGSEGRFIVGGSEVFCDFKDGLARESGKHYCLAWGDVDAKEVAEERELRVGRRLRKEEGWVPI